MRMPTAMLPANPAAKSLTKSPTAAVEALRKAGAVPRDVGERLGPVATAEDTVPEADALMECSRDAYRHLKTINVPRAAVPSLARRGIPMLLPSGDVDLELIRMSDGKGITAIATCVKAVGRHRHPERDRNPPLV